MDEQDAFRLLLGSTGLRPVISAEMYDAAMSGLERLCRPRIEARMPAKKPRGWRRKLRDSVRSSIREM